MSGTRRRPGLLGPQVEGYQGWLLGLGYTPATVRNMLKELGQVGCWMASEDLAASDLDRPASWSSAPSDGRLAIDALWVHELWSFCCGICARSGSLQQHCPHGSAG
jgi:hypothetical protein